MGVLLKGEVLESGVSDISNYGERNKNGRTSSGYHESQPNIQMTQDELFVYINKLNTKYGITKDKENK